MDPRNLHPAEKRLFDAIRAKDLKAVMRESHYIQTVQNDSAAQLELQKANPDLPIPSLSALDPYSKRNYLHQAIAKKVDDAIVSHLFKLISEEKDNEQLLFGTYQAWGWPQENLFQLFLGHQYSVFPMFLDQAEKCGQKVWLKTLPVGEFPLSYAARNVDSEKVIAALLSKISKEKNSLDVINWPDKDGLTALHHACRKKTPSLPVIRQLVQNGADLNVIDNEGKKPLEYIGSPEHLKLITDALSKIKKIESKEKPIYLAINDYRVHLLDLKKQISTYLLELEKKPTLTTAGRLLHALQILLGVGGYGFGLYSLINKCIEECTKENGLYGIGAFFWGLGGLFVTGSINMAIYTFGLKRGFQTILQPNEWEAILTALQSDIKIIEELHIRTEQQKLTQNDYKQSFYSETEIYQLKQYALLLEKEMGIIIVKQTLQEINQFISRAPSAINQNQLTVGLSASFFQPKKEKQSHVMDMPVNEVNEKSPLLKRIN